MINGISQSNALRIVPGKLSHSASFSRQFEHIFVILVHYVTGTVVRMQVH